MSKFENIKLFIIDVDGTMTDSGVYFDDAGNELKKYTTRDYVGVLAAHYIGAEVIIVTGRTFPGTERRARELKVDAIYQNVKNKKVFIKEYLEKKGLNKENLGYIGDDLNDYAAMKVAGFRACPADACIEIKNMADYVSSAKGGEGVLQDVFRYLLSEKGEWLKFIDDVVADGY